jgi:hypothetical protein
MIFFINISTFSRISVKIIQIMKSKLQINIVNSWFGEYAHRNPDAALPLMYAMACIEIVANESGKAKKIYQSIINAWGKPNIKSLYDQLISDFSDNDIKGFENIARNPEILFEDDINKPWIDFIDAVNQPEFGELVFKGKWKKAAESLTTEYIDACELFSLILEFIFVGFNREDDLDEGRCKVIPSVNPPWLLLMVMYRTAFEHNEITLDRLRKIYKVRKIKGKVYDLERVVTMESNSRMHRRITSSAKKTNMIFRHDYKFLDAAYLWYQCRVAYPSIEEFLSAEAKNGNDKLDYKNVQKEIKHCDDAIGYLKRGNYFQIPDIEE